MLVMTTLFSIFAPIFVTLQLKLAVFLLSISTVLLWCFIMKSLFLNKNLVLGQVSMNLFSFNMSSTLLFSVFLSLSCLNLISFMLYSYPVTTTLSFNLAAALSCWLSGMLIMMTKVKPVSSLLPSNTPWYLVPFLCVVELISIMVRPVTLCFRLLANMVAGHVLLALIAKISYFWFIGSLFGMLEIMVAVVQAFVFSMLVSVYLDEVFSH